MAAWRIASALSKDRWSGAAAVSLREGPVALADASGEGVAVPTKTDDLRKGIENAPTKIVADKPKDSPIQMAALRERTYAGRFAGGSLGGWFCRDGSLADEVCGWDTGKASNESL